MKKVVLMLALLMGIAVSAQAVKPGYHGNVEAGYLFGMGDFDGSSMYEISTTHGWNFNSHLFAGIGVTAQVYTWEDGYGDETKFNLPVFAQAKYVILNGKISPFVDARVGYSVAGEFTGFYVQPAIGCRFGLGERFGLNVAIGYTYMKTGYQFIKSGDDLNLTGISARVGFEF